MDRQAQRYVLGLVAFGFVAVSASAGLLDAVLALAAFGTVVALPRVRPRQSSRKPRRRPAPRRVDASQLVPDDPSLVLDVAQLAADAY